MSIEIEGMAPLIQVFNMRRSLEFYRDILGFEVVSDSGGGDDSSWVWLRANGVDLMLNDQYEPGHEPQSPPAERTKWHGDTCLFKPAWFDIPYHYYIAADGQIAEGRKLKYAGDTNTEYDPTSHALVVLEGSFNTEQPTPAQIDSMKRIVAWLARKYKVAPANIKGHGDYAKTACPGENLKVLLPELRTTAN